MNLNKKSKFRAIGLSSFFALSALLGAAVFCPGLGDDANAATSSNATFQIDFILDRNNIQSQIISSDINQVSNSQVNATFLIDFLLSPRLSISVDGLDGTMNAGNINPTATGTTTSIQRSFTASSNSLGGIGVVVHGSGSTNLEKKDNNTVVATIPTLGSGVSKLSDIPANRWGYNLTQATNAPSAESLSYSPISTNAAAAVNPVPDAGSSDTSEKWWLTFGAKVDLAQASGTYSKEVKVQVVPSAQSVGARNSIENTLSTYSLDSEATGDEISGDTNPEETDTMAKETVDTE